MAKPEVVRDNDAAEWARPYITNLADSLRQRSLAILVIRLLGMLVAMSALAPLASWWVEGLRDGDLFNVSYYLPRIAPAVALPVGGVALWFVALPISRRMVFIVTHPACPACGFDLRGLPAPKCPECSMEFPDAAPVPRGSASLSQSAWTVAVVALLRVGAALLTVYQVSTSLTYLWWMTDDLVPLALYPFLGIEELVETVLLFLSPLGLGIGLWVLAPLIAKLAVRASFRAPG